MKYSRLPLENMGINKNISDEWYETACPYTKPCTRYSEFQFSKLPCTQFKPTTLWSPFYRPSSFTSPFHWRPRDRQTGGRGTSTCRFQFGDQDPDSGNHLSMCLTRSKGSLARCPPEKRYPPRSARVANAGSGADPGKLLLPWHQGGRGPGAPKFTFPLMSPLLFAGQRGCRGPAALARTRRSSTGRSPRESVLAH